MEKLKMQTADMADRNVELLGQMFPNCLTEIINADGKLVRAIDFDKLRQELACEVVEGADERYQFTWPDKRNAIRLANAPINKTLRPFREESVDFDNTENLYIEGDNLEVLKLLRENYLGKVKMIYIDPPYNTGNDFVYNDDFAKSKAEFEAQSGLFDEESNRMADPMVQNTESNGRFHTDWLNMIYPRLKVAKDLLSDDGVIFISIDDNEVENLRKVCDEIYGEHNRQAIISYVRKTSGKQDSSNFMKSTEYILCYSKSELWECQPIVAGEQVLDRYNKIDEQGNKYRETDLRKTGNADRREDRPLMFYPFYFNPISGDLKACANEDIALESAGYIKILPIKPDGSDGRWRWGLENAIAHIEFLVARLMPKYKDQNKYTIYEKDYIDKKGDVRTVKEHTAWDRTEFNSDNAMMEFKKLGFSNQLFPFPKVSLLVKHMCYLADTQNSVILDFFSGSATTAHAVMQLNAEDGGNRRFIMVQLPEVTDEKSEAYKAGYKNICEIGKERIRRAGKKISDDIQDKIQTLGFTINSLLNAKPSATVAMLPKQEQEAIAKKIYNEQILPKMKEKEQLELRLAKLDTGFRVLKLDTSNMKDVYYTPAETPIQQTLGFEELVDNIKWNEGRTPEDLLFQVLPECNLPLSSKIEEREIHGKKVFVVEDGYLIACFDKDINESVITAIAKEKPYYFVMCDCSIATDNVADNFDQIFNAYSKETIRRII